MWLVIAGVLSFDLCVLVLVGLVEVARELTFERPFEANSMDNGTVAQRYRDTEQLRSERPDVF